MFNPVKSRVRKTVDSYYVVKALIHEAKTIAEYEKSILDSQAKIGEYKPVPYIPVVIA
jgi:hypothetical protein